MSLLSFPFSTDIVLVADASVVINLNATGRAQEVIKAVSNPFSVTANTLAELADGMNNGHDDGPQLQRLIDDGFVKLVHLGDVGNSIYETLIEGSALQTLDDGEAATIGYANEIGAVALIDERKARNLCADRFPELPIFSTVELLLLEAVACVLGPQGHVSAVIDALQKARMRVPHEHIPKVIALIGHEHALRCTSLPKAARLPINMP